MSNTSLHIPDLLKRGKWSDDRVIIPGNSHTWSWERKTTEVKYFVIHHSAGPVTQTPTEIANYHLNARKWGGVGYHFIITPDGVVHYVGDVGTARANVKDMNDKVIGVCLVGDFTKHNPTDNQILSAHDLAKFFINAPQWPNLDSWNNLKGHKHFQATACPGPSWEGPPDSIYERIKNRVPYISQVKQPDEIKWPEASIYKQKIRHLEEEIAKMEKGYSSLLDKDVESKEKIEKLESIKPFLSRKLWLAILATVIAVTNKALDLQLESAEVLTLISPLLAYIGTEGLADVVERAKK